MNNRERFLRTLRFEPVDRIPYHELGLWGQTVDLYLEAGMSVEATKQNFFYGNDFFRLDKRDFIPIDVMLRPAFDHETIEEDDRTLIFRDAQGIVHKALKTGTVRGTRPSMDQYLRFPVETAEDFEDMKKRYDSKTPGRYPEDWDARVKEWQTRDYPLCLLTNGSFGFYSMARRWMGTENLSFAFYDQPALIQAMMEFLADFFIEVTTPALEQITPDYFNFFEDLAYKTGPLLSPDQFRKFMMTPYQRVIDHLKKYGIEHIWLDSDGNTEVLIPLFLEMGVTCHWPCEIAADMDPVRLRNQYGKDLALCGGIDKRELTKDRDAIRQELLKKLPPLLDSGGYIPTVDHTVPHDVPYENFLFYLEMKREIAEGRQRL
ncbi:MAG: uroporphyrinogen decarboxylase family protein [Planctomycetota bacterium]|jgi:uroporphyrinogen decarboxylase|nr:uroporphyrinogen decarboxylase family protein [Planctomycetota bacterium]MDP7250565.1 uroporphyrinogen decarboxylase family protein [Planctomycetota bacterium]